MPPGEYHGSVGDWFRDPVSLSSPCVPIKPVGKWWNPIVANLAMKSIADPNVYAVLMTGRSGDNVAIRYRVAEILSTAGYDFDEIHLKTGQASTVQYKTMKLQHILRKHRDITEIEIWDDRHHHFPDFIALGEKFNIPVKVNPVKRYNLKVACSSIEFNDVLDESLLRNIIQESLSAGRRVDTKMKKEKEIFTSINPGYTPVSASTLDAMEQEAMNETAIRSYISAMLESGNRQQLQPLMDPLFNLREIVKELTLLEDHINQPSKQCLDCINKHLMKCEALSEEAISLDGDNQYRFLTKVPQVIRGWHKAVLDNDTMPTNLSSQMRKFRKMIMPHVADKFEV